MKRFSAIRNWFADEDVAAGAPFYAVMFLILIGLYVGVVISNENVRQPGPLALFTGLMLVHGVLHGLSFRLIQRPRWLVAYCLVQGAIVLTLGFLTRTTASVLALNMAMIGETAGLWWPNRRGVAASATFFLALLATSVVVVEEARALLQLLPMIAGVLLFVLVFVILYIRQVTARGEAQTLLGDLETAHRQLQEYAARIEELTIAQERQRMARELHDTLAQGLAGLILQLEAADSHLEQGNPARAQAVVQQAMRRARTTLDEARRAIQALRPAALEEGSLVEALGREVDQFAEATGIRTTFDVGAAPPRLPPAVALNVLRVIQEGLSNVARHAQARHVLVRLAEDGQGLQVMIEDDGMGFDPAEGLVRPGCFGLSGMVERAERLGGSLDVESAPGRGTRIRLSLQEDGTGEANQ